jgi:O-acetyl-ADP-ribose deacetylase (regulator of RNase III)
MIKIIKGNILNANEDIICQQVNCKGVMGSGLALQILKKYPEVYGQYKNFCDKYRWGLLGSVCFVNTKDKIIACLFGQNDYGRSKRVYTDYCALEKSLTNTKIYAQKENLSIALPHEIGCGLANGDWNVVLDIITRVFDDMDVSIYKYQMN